MINSLENLYDKLDELSKHVQKFCFDCEIVCCRGYIMLLREEAEQVLKNGGSVLEYKNPKGVKGYMLDTYPRDVTGNFRCDVHAPECPNRSLISGCSLYNVRPLICRMYPLDLQEIKDKPNIYWVVHKRCEFMQKLPKEDLENWLSKAKSIVINIGSKLLKEIEIEWKKLALGMTYPPDFEGYDLFILGSAFPIKSA